MEFYILGMPQIFGYTYLAISEYVKFNQEDAIMHKFINLALLWSHVLIFNFIMYHTLVPFVP